MASKETVQIVQSIPTEDTVNREGFASYSIPDELRLLSMLCTLNIELQYYRTENETVKELRDLIEYLGHSEPYFVAQCIVYARCIADGKRSINHLAAALHAPFVSGTDWGKRFYGLFNRKTQQGGCIYRPDDMSEIKDAFAALNDRPLSAAMKAGFKKAIESMDTYQLAKYSKNTIDISNLVHPNPEVSKAEVDGKKVIDLLMQGETVSADTWEVAQSEAGQEVAKAVKEGKLTEEEAKTVLAEAKNENWLELLQTNKLGILAALRNIRSMMKDPNESVIDRLCALISDGDRIRQGLIMPYQIDIAYEILKTEFSSYRLYSQVCSALLKGYKTAVPNLAEALPGKTCVMIDCSGSMRGLCTNLQKGREAVRISSTACEKAGLIAATIAQATGADIVRFGSRAEFFEYNIYKNVFELGNDISSPNMGNTNIGAAFDLIRQHNLKYDRIILLSDNECNMGRWLSTAYKQYVHDVCNPYVYCVDFCAYGTAPLKGDKIMYYAGYGYQLFEDIASKEFNPTQHIDKVRKVVI